MEHNEKQKQWRLQLRPLPAAVKCYNIEKFGFKMK